MAYTHSSPDDEMRYIRKRITGAGNVFYEVRIWVRILGYQVFFGSFNDLEAAMTARDAAEREYLDKSAYQRPFKIHKPRSKPQPALFDSNI